MREMFKFDGQFQISEYSQTSCFLVVLGVKGLKTFGCGLFHKAVFKFKVLH